MAQQQQQSPASAAATAAERAALSPTQVHGHPMAAWHHGGHGGGGGGAPNRGYLDNGTREKRKARAAAHMPLGIAAAGCRNGGNCTFCMRAICTDTSIAGQMPY